MDMMTMMMMMNGGMMGGGKSGGGGMMQMLLPMLMNQGKNGEEGDKGGKHKVRVSQKTPRFPNFRYNLYHINFDMMLKYFLCS